MRIEKIMRAHAKQGDKVVYRVAPSTDTLFFTAYKIAFCSA